LIRLLAFAINRYFSQKMTGRHVGAKERGQSTAAAYVPLSFAPGEAYQFDWSHEIVLLSGVQSLPRRSGRLGQ
jgi:hypothetical protein